MLVAYFLLFECQAHAGSLKVVPAKLFIDAGEETSTLRVINESERKTTIQLSSVKWDQNERGEDRYEATKDILLFPKIVTIDKGEERIIRVGYQREKAGVKEKTYRVYLKELPVSKPGKTALKFRLRLGIPVFITPPTEIKDWSIEGVDLSGGMILVEVKNSGNTHLMVNKIKAMALDDSGNEVFSKEIGGWYVLAGVSKIYTLDIPENKCSGVKTIKLELESGNVIKKTQIHVDVARCRKNNSEEQGKENKD